MRRRGARRDWFYSGTATIRFRAFAATGVATSRPLRPTPHDAKRPQAREAVLLRLHGAVVRRRDPADTLNRDSIPLEGVTEPARQRCCAARELVGEDGRSIVQFWLDVMNDETAKMSDRLEASRRLADRGWGRPGASVDPVQDAEPTSLRTLAEIDREIEALSAELNGRALRP